jgi:hypothetical protein
MAKRPTKDPHYGSVRNSKTFEQAYDTVSQNIGKVYRYA